ncbi:hypothetical protein [Cellulomonas sp. KH9]|uniref:hypothetical protein n=1 Tax=Cellulomonas sp. KH9 TaxID=1855324 RepID=UPI000B7D5A30|nr:hypothetical protein [Cellulomonas sp. KH9]
MLDLHEQVVVAVEQSIQDVRSADAGRAHIHEVVGQAGIGRTTLLARLRDRLAAPTGQGISPSAVVVTLSAAGETGSPDVAAMMLLGQVQHEVARWSAARRYEEVVARAWDDVRSSLPDTAIHLVALAVPGLEAVLTLKDLYDRAQEVRQHQRNLVEMRRAYAERDAAAGPDTTEQTVEHLRDLAADARRAGVPAPVLVVLLDDAHLARPDFSVWLTNLTSVVVSSDARSSVVVVSTARSPQHVPLVPHQRGPVPPSGGAHDGLLDLLRASDALDGVMEVRRWGDRADAPHAVAADALAGCGADEARALLRAHLERATGDTASARSLADAYVDARPPGPEGVAPGLVVDHARLIARKVQLGPVEQEWLAALPDSAHAAVLATAHDLLASDTPTGTSAAVVLALLATAGGQTLRTVLTDAAETCSARGVAEAIERLVHDGLLVEVPFPIGEDPAVALVSAAVGETARAHLRNAALLDDDALRRAHAAALGRQLHAVLPTIHDTVDGAAVPALLDGLRGLGIPRGVDADELRRAGVAELPRAVLLAAATGGAHERLTVLGRVPGDARDGAWCLLVAGLVRAARRRDVTPTDLRPFERAVMHAAESTTTAGHASYAVALVCRDVMADGDGPDAGGATALLHELALLHRRAAHVLLGVRSDPGMRRHGATLLGAHIDESGDVLDDERCDLARFYLEHDEPAAARAVLLPVLRSSDHAAILLAECLRADETDDAANEVPGLRPRLLELAGAHARAAVALWQLEPAAGAEHLERLRPHLLEDVAATEAFLELLPQDPAREDREAAIRACHRHARHLPPQRLAVALAGLARTVKDRQAARVHLESAIDEPVVAATLLATDDGRDPALQARVCAVLERAAEGTDRQSRADAAAAFAILSDDGVRERPGVIDALDALTQRRGTGRGQGAGSPDRRRVERWAADLARSRGNPSAVRVHVSAVLDRMRAAFPEGSPLPAGDAGHGYRELLVDVVEMLRREIHEARTALDDVTTVPEQSLDLCTLTVPVRGWVRRLAGDDSAEDRLAREVRGLGQAVLAAAAEDHPAAAVHRLRPSRGPRRDGQGLAPDDLRALYAAHSHEPAVLAALVRHAVRIDWMTDDGGSLYWRRLCEAAGTHPTAARHLLDTLRHMRRDGDVLDDERVAAGVEAASTAAAVDHEIAVAAFEAATSYRLPTVDHTFALLLEHAPFSARAARVCFRHLQHHAAGGDMTAGRPPMLTPGAHALLQAAARTAPDVARGYVEWLTREGVEPSDDDMQVVRRLSARLPVAAGALWARATDPADAFTALSRMARHARGCARGSGRRDHVVSTVARYGMPAALELTATGADAADVTASWIASARRDRRIAHWLLGRLDAGGRSRELMTAGAGADLVAAVGAALDHPVEAARHLPMLRALARHAGPTVARPVTWTLAPGVRRVVAAGLRPQVGSVERELLHLWVDGVAARPEEPAQHVELALGAAALLRPDLSRPLGDEDVHWARAVAALAPRSAAPAEVEDLVATARVLLRRGDTGAEVDVERLVALLAVSSSTEAWATWEPFAERVLGDPRTRRALADAARGAAATHSLLAALVALVDGEDPSRRAADVLRRLRHEAGYRTADSATGAMLALATVHLSLTRAQRDRATTYLAGCTRPGIRLAAALLGPLKDRTAALRPVVEAFVTEVALPGARVTVAELLLLADSAQEAEHALELAWILEKYLLAHPAVAGADRLRLRLVRLASRAHSPLRSGYVQPVLDRSRDDVDLALELVAADRLQEVLTDGERAAVTETLLAHAGDRLDVVQALVGRADPRSPDPRLVAALPGLLAAAPTDVDAALCALALGQHGGAPRTALREAFRCLTGPALRDPGLVVRVAERTVTRRAQAAATEWLVRMAVGSRALPSAQAAVAESRRALAQRRGRSTTHALVALATTPVARREAARHLQWTVAGRRMDERDAVAVLAVDREDPTARQRAVDLLRRTTDVGAAEEHARLLAVLHPAALVGVAALQPVAGRSLVGLVRELAGRCADDDLCTAEMLDALVVIGGDPRPRMSRRALVRYLTHGLTEARRWLARGSEACPVPAATAARLLSARSGDPREELALARALAGVMAGGNLRRRSAAWDGWDLLSEEARASVPLGRLRRPTAAQPVVVRTSGTAFVVRDSTDPVLVWPTAARTGRRDATGRPRSAATVRPAAPSAPAVTRRQVREVQRRASTTPGGTAAARSSWGGDSAVPTRSAPPVNRSRASGVSGWAPVRAWRDLPTAAQWVVTSLLGICAAGAALLTLQRPGAVVLSLVGLGVALGPGVAGARGWWRQGVRGAAALLVLVGTVASSSPDPEVATLSVRLGTAVVVAAWLAAEIAVWAHRQVGAPYGVPALGHGWPTPSPRRHGVALRPTGAFTWAARGVLAAGWLLGVGACVLVHLDGVDAVTEPLVYRGLVALASGPDVVAALSGFLTYATLPGVVVALGLPAVLLQLLSFVHHPASWPGHRDLVVLAGVVAALPVVPFVVLAAVWVLNVLVAILVVVLGVVVVGVLLCLALGERD